MLLNKGILRNFGILKHQKYLSRINTKYQKYESQYIYHDDLELSWFETTIFVKQA